MPERAPARAASFSAASLAGLISQCRRLRELHQIHTQILTPGLLRRRYTDSLLSRILFFCATNPSPSSRSYASCLFQSLLSPSLFEYNAIIRSQSQSVPPSLCPLSLYIQMLAGGIRPDHLTLPFLFKVCPSHLSFITGQALHGHVVKLGFHHDTFIQNSMTHMYSTGGALSCAQKLFDEMPLRDIVSKNSILMGYMRCGKLDAALTFFSGMEEKNIITWNSVITGLIHGGRAQTALSLFQEMQFSGGNSVKPDKVTAASVISACGSLGALDQGKWVHSYLKRKHLDFDVVISTALIDMYAKCGCLTEATKVFDEMPERDVWAWTAMISTLAVHGSGEKALSLFEEMVRLGFKPNRVTFGALLNAFAHSGLVEKSRWYFDLMQRVYLIEPQPHHFACMVDLLGRAGLFSEAETLIESMPMKPDSFVWGALIGACRMHGNVELGERVADRLMESDPHNHAFYVVLSDIYAMAKRYEDVKKLRDFMKEREIEKTAPGCSMIEVDGKVCEFSFRGIAEEQLKEIDWVLNGLNCAL